MASLAACSPEKKPVAMETYTAEEGFSIEYPQHWTVEQQPWNDETQMRGGIVITPEQDPRNPYQTPPQRITLTGYVNLDRVLGRLPSTKDYAKEVLLKGEDVVESLPATIDGNEAFIAQTKNAKTGERGLVALFYADSKKKANQSVLLSIAYRAKDDTFDESLGRSAITSFREKILETAEQRQLAMQQQQRDFLERFGDISPNYVPQNFVSPRPPSVMLVRQEDDTFRVILKHFICGNTPVRSEVMSITKVPGEELQKKSLKDYLKAEVDRTLKSDGQSKLLAMTVGSSPGYLVTRPNSQLPVKLMWTSNDFFYNIFITNDVEECRVSDDEILKTAESLLASMNQPAPLASVLRAQR